MTEMTHDEVRDELPDMLHGAGDARRREAIEAHLKSCASCAAELRVLQMVKGAPSFAPMIDAVRIASAIPPYGGVPSERPASRARTWQMGAAVAAVVIIVGTVITRGTSAPDAPPRGAVVSAPVTVGADAPTVGAPAAPPLTPPAAAPVPPPVASPPQRQRGELQVADRLTDLPDQDVVRLLDAITGLDGLPSTEPEDLGVGDPANERGGEAGR